MAPAVVEGDLLGLGSFPPAEEAAPVPSGDVLDEGRAAKPPSSSGGSAVGHSKPSSSRELPSQRSRSRSAALSAFKTAQASTSGGTEVEVAEVPLGSAVKPRRTRKGTDDNVMTKLRRSFSRDKDMDKDGRRSRDPSLSDGEGGSKRRDKKRGESEDALEAAVAQAPSSGRGKFMGMKGEGFSSLFDRANI